MRTGTSKTNLRKSYPAPASVLAAYNDLHTIAPKLFPVWGSRNSSKAPLWVNWSRLGKKNPWEALPAVIQFVSALDLDWAFDSETYSIEVKDAEGWFAVNAAEPHVALMVCLRQMLEARPELTTPDEWSDYDSPPRRTLQKEAVA